MKYDIFISYRRDGGYDTAKHLFDLLVRDGYRVSFDLDTLHSGDFDVQLYHRIDQCKDFILIVDHHTFDRTISQDTNQNNDWLRCELAYALKKNKNIIPIFLSGVSGFPDNLPEDIVGVISKNGPEYNRYHFNAFYTDLKKRFLMSSNYRLKIILFVIIILLISSICVISRIIISHNVYSCNVSHQIDSTSSANFFDESNNVTESIVEVIKVKETVDIQLNQINEIDSDRYYVEKQDDRHLFLKGLRRSNIFSIYKNAESKVYTYKSGLIFDIYVQYLSQITEDVEFLISDEDGIMVALDTDFETIGYNTEYGYDGYYNVYGDNQYQVGQYDLNNDGKDELIIAVRTAGDDVTKDGQGIGINVFEYVDGIWKRTAVLNKSTNVLPANAKMVQNSIYVYWLRYDEKYTYVNDSFVCDTDFYGRVFTKDDFD